MATSSVTPYSEVMPTMRRSALFLVLLLSASMARADEVVEWVAREAVPLRSVELTDDFSDLGPLKHIIGEARIIGFGEGTHDTHELWAFRNRLFAYLVEEHGVTAMAAETGLAPSFATDDYALGKDVSRIRAAQGVFSWSDSVFDENLQIVDWMRAYNARPTTMRKIRFYGLEMSGCMRPEGRPLIENALSYVARLDPARSKASMRQFAPLLQKFSRDGYGALTADQRASLLAAVQDLVSLFERWQVVWISRTSARDYERAYRQAVAARQLTTHFRMKGEGRDIAAAQNLRWALEREGPEGRLFVFAHNSHVAKWRKRPKNDDDLHSTMGEFLNDYFGDDMVVIGSLYDRGAARDLLGLFRPRNETYAVPPSKSGSLNGLAAKSGRARFLLDLKKIPDSGTVPQWFSRLRAIRNINVRRGYHQIDTRAAFDALVFLRDITPLHLNAAANSATARHGCTR